MPNCEHPDLRWSERHGIWCCRACGKFFNARCDKTGHLIPVIGKVGVKNVG